MIHCKITEAGVTRRFEIDEKDDPHAGWRLLFAFIAKCNSDPEYKEYGRSKAAECDGILKAAKSAKEKEQADAAKPKENEKARPRKRKVF